MPLNIIGYAIIGLFCVLTVLAYMIGHRRGAMDTLEDLESILKEHNKQMEGTDDHHSEAQ